MLMANVLQLACQLKPPTSARPHFSGKWVSGLKSAELRPHLQSETLKGSWDMGLESI